MHRILYVLGNVVSHRWGVIALGMASAMFGVSTADAGISFVDLFRSGSYTQTGDGNSLADGGFFFDALLHSTDPGEFASATLTYPGSGSPATLSIPLDPFVLIYASSIYGTQAAMDADFPTGDYVFDAGAFSTTVTYAGDDYPQSLPYLTGTDYSDLQGMDAAVWVRSSWSPVLSAGVASRRLRSDSKQPTTRT